MNRLALVFLLGAVLVAVGAMVLITSTDFDPNPFLENQTNETGQLAGTLVASAGAVIVAIAAAAQAICRGLTTD
jgi:hypothetical protein